VRSPAFLCTTMTENKRTPTHCPHCGYDGAVGGIGRFGRETKISDLDSDGVVRYFQEWFMYHCPDCGEKTAMLEEEEPVEDYE